MQTAPEKAKRRTGTRPGPGNGNTLLGGLRLLPAFLHGVQGGFFQGKAVFGKQAFHFIETPFKLPVRPAMAVSGSIPFFRHRLTTENRRSPSSSVTCGSSSGTGRISSHSAVSSFTLSRAPWASGPVKPPLWRLFSGASRRGAWEAVPCPFHEGTGWSPRLFPGV